MASIAAKTAAVAAPLLRRADCGRDGGVRDHPSGTDPGRRRNAGRSGGRTRIRADPITSPASIGPDPNPDPTSAPAASRSFDRSITSEGLPPGRLSASRAVQADLEGSAQGATLRSPPRHPGLIAGEWLDLS
jgi:hypothetical protein